MYYFLQLCLLANSSRAACAFQVNPISSINQLRTTQGFLRKTVPSSALAATLIDKTDEEWKEILTPEQYYVLREDGTEPPWRSPLNEVTEDGVFRCAGCGSPLFPSSSKFEVRFLYIIFSQGTYGLNLKLYEKNAQPLIHLHCYIYIVWVRLAVILCSY
jgi:hypothetical protein